MDKDKILEERDAIGRVSGCRDCDNKLDLLEKHIRSTEKNIIATRNCYDYVLNEVIVANEKITKELSWNQKRLELLKGIADELALYSDEQNDSFKEYFTLLRLGEMTEKINNVNLNK